MEQFFSYFGQLLLYTFLPFLGCSLAVFFFHRVYCNFITQKTEEPLLLAVSVLSVPLREVSHLISCFLFAHRVEDVRLFDRTAKTGEYGYVDHSYDPRNPIAVIGNFFFAVAPSIFGLFAIFVVVFCCFRQPFLAYAEEIRAMEQSGAPLLDYLKTAVDFLPSVFRDTETALVAKIIGCVLLAMLAFSVFITPKDLEDAFGGFCAILALLFTFALVLCFFDNRVRRMVMGGFRTTFMYVFALFSVAVVFSAALAILGLLYGTVRDVFYPELKGEKK